MSYNFDDNPKIKEALASLEEQRKADKKAATNIRLKNVGIFVGAIILFIFIKNLFVGSPIAFIIYWIVVIGIIVFFESGAPKVHKESYKEKIVPMLLDILMENIRQSDDDEIIYEPNYNAPLRLYENNPLFIKTAINNIYSEDLFYGQFGKTKFTFYEVHYWAEYRDRETTIFKGLAFIADFNKDFNGLTTISHDEPRQSLGNSTKLEHVVMEPGPFSERYVVYSTNGQVARYLISPAFMERIIELEDRVKKAKMGFVEVLFRKSCMEIYIYTRKDNFEALENVETTTEQLKADYELLEFLLSFINVMKLNTRIWTKE